MGLDGSQAKAKGCLRKLGQGNVRYLDDSDDVEGGITELQERLEVLVRICISIQQVAQLVRSEDDQKMFEVFWQEEQELSIASWSRWEAQRKRLSRIGKKMSRHKSGNTNAEKNTRDGQECGRR